MTRLLRILYAVCIAIPGLFMVMLLAVRFVPDRTIRQISEHVMADYGLTFQAEELGTAIPFAIVAKKLTVSDSSGVIIAIDRLRLRLQLLPLVTGRVRILISGEHGPPLIRGVLTIFPARCRSVNVRIDQLGLDAIPLIKTRVGGKFTGTLRADLDLVPKASGVLSGAAKLHIKSLSVKDASLAGILLPKIDVPETRALLRINDNSLVIDNLGFQGDGIYLRLGGTVKAEADAPMDLKVELMPTPEFIEEQKAVFVLMRDFQTAPGNYRLHLGGTVTAPQLLKTEPRSL